MPQTELGKSSVMPHPEETIVAPPIMALLIPAQASRIAGVIPDPPNDVIASTNEYRSFMKDGKLQVHFGPTHYHLLSR